MGTFGGELGMTISTSTISGLEDEYVLVEADVVNKHSSLNSSTGLTFIPVYK